MSVKKGQFGKEYLNNPSFDAENADEISAPLRPDPAMSPMSPPGKWAAGVHAVPSFGEKEENEGLLIEVGAVQELTTKEWLLVAKAGIKISKHDVKMLKKGKLNEELIKKLAKLRKALDRMLKNKQTLIKLMKS